MSDDTLDVLTRSPVIRAIQAPILAACAELLAAVQGVISGRFLATAQGVSLDVLGRLVGLYPRPTVDAAGILYFAPDRAGQGPDIPGIGVFVTNAPTAGTVPVDDERYRDLIRAQIEKNHTRHGSAPEILRYGLQAFGFPISARNEGNADVSLTVPATITPEYVAQLLRVVDNNLADRIYSLPLPSTARIVQIRFRFPSTFAPDLPGGPADLSPVGVGYVVNA